MKKNILGLGALVSLLTGGLYFSRASAVTKIVEPTPIEQVLGTNNIPDGNLIVTPVVLGDEVTLIPNFKNAKTSLEIFSENSCDYLTSGGFYTKEARPVGLFKSNEDTLRPEHESSLFDGFFTINEMGVPRITRILPTDNLRIALQSGPILYENGSPAKLSIRNDVPERRVVAIVTGENKIYFMMIKSSLLGDLPKVLSNWKKEENIALADAINLDGGSASAFRSKDFAIPEISPIGSAFCVRYGTSQ